MRDRHCFLLAYVCRSCHGFLHYKDPRARFDAGSAGDIVTIIGVVIVIVIVIVGSFRVSSTTFEDGAPSYGDYLEIIERRSRVLLLLYDLHEIRKEDE